jgi:hypothetical protein
MTISCALNTTSMSLTTQGGPKRGIAAGMSFIKGSVFTRIPGDWGAKWLMRLGESSQKLGRIVPYTGAGGNLWRPALRHHPQLSHD